MLGFHVELQNALMGEASIYISLSFSKKPFFLPEPLVSGSLRKILEH